MRRVSLILLVVATVFAGVAHAAAVDCGTEAAHAEDAAVGQAEARVRDAFDAPSERGFSGAVPVAAQAAIQTLKQTLAEAADRQLACVTSGAPNAKAVEVRVAIALRANRPAGISGQDASASGLIVRVREAWGLPEWLLVRIGFPLGSCCIADDNLLLVYAYRDGGWQRVIRLQSTPYAKVSGAWGDFFDYLVLPAAGGHARRIVVAHGKPWPMSCWSGFTIDVIQPTAAAKSGQRVFDVDHGYRRCGARPELTRTPDGFELAIAVGTLGMPDMIRNGMFRYRQQGNRYMRVQPVAFDASGFVGVWLAEPWPEVVGWTGIEARPELRKLHSDVRHRVGFDWVKFGAVDACPGDRYQVALDLEQIRLNKVQSRRLVNFMVRADAHDVFTLLAVRAEPDPRCDRQIAARQN